ncbi:hypothetical protein LCGC14_0705690 [marine sediment metagenome]|uniref:Uncharacterized protein n=1 Tax=marine sediment metagenome TaxID=412755 RepID=A0A0F9TP53_9ZZZZ|nr:hypothetical protein [bacterium]
MKGLLSVLHSPIQIVVAPVADTSIYAAGDLIGGKLTLSPVVVAAASGGVIQTVVLVDQADQKSAIDIVFFGADPTGTTFTDQAALDVADADNLNIVGVVSIGASDYVSFNDNALATVRPSLAFKLDKGVAMYAALVCRGTPTYAAATDLQLTVTLI